MSDSSANDTITKKIEELTYQKALEVHSHDCSGQTDVIPDDSSEVISCKTMALPSRLNEAAVAIAVAVNPTNRPSFLPDGVDGPDSLTIATDKYFGPQPRTLTVSFTETAPQDLKTRIVEHLNAWNDCCGIRFHLTNGTGQVRISRQLRGYWSYVGTDVLQIPRDRPTMNLQGFTMNTSEEEFRRVVRHEAGHTLGFKHEHMRKELVDLIDPQKAYDYFWETQRWDEEQVDRQVLTPLDQNSIMGTPADQTSIMCYRLPARIMRDNQAIVGGMDINATDCRFAGHLYPKPLETTAAMETTLETTRETEEADTSANGLPDLAEENIANYDEEWSADEDVDAVASLEEFIGQ